MGLCSVHLSSGKHTSTRPALLNHVHSTLHGASSALVIFGILAPIVALAYVSLSHTRALLAGSFASRGE